MEANDFQNSKNMNGRSQKASTRSCSPGPADSNGRIRSSTEDCNPFCYSLPLTTLDILLYVFNSLWLLPLRLFLLVIPSFACGMILCYIVSIGIRSETDQPLKGWRKFALQRIGTILNKVFLFGMGFHWVKTTGRPNPSEAPVMVAVPHSSPLDMFLVSRLVIPTMVSRSDAQGFPLLGTMITHTLKTIFVSREEEESRRQCINEIRRRANEADSWPPVLLFPEGTTTNRKALLKFKSGAFTPGVPVQPVIVKFKNRLNAMVWAEEGMRFLTSMILTLCSFHNAVEIEYLPAYYPSSEEKDSPPLYAENVREHISSSIGIPLSKYRVEDMLLGRHSKHLGLPFEIGILNYGNLKDLFGILFLEIKKIIKRFAGMDVNKDGYITIGNFADYLRVPQDLCSKAVFSLFDPDSQGQVSLQNYLHKLLSAAPPLLSDQQFLDQAFEFLDSDKDGYVTDKDFHEKVFRTDDHTIIDISLDTASHKNRSHSHKTAISGNTELDGYPWDKDGFKLFLQNNLEYLLLISESLKTAITSEQPNNNMIRPQPSTTACLEDELSPDAIPTAKLIPI